MYIFKHMHVHVHVYNNYIHTNSCVYSKVASYIRRAVFYLGTHGCWEAVHYPHSPQRVDWTLRQSQFHARWQLHLSVPGSGTSHWPASLSTSLHLPPSTETSWRQELAGSPAEDVSVHLQTQKKQRDMWLKVRRDRDTCTGSKMNEMMTYTLTTGLLHVHVHVQERMQSRIHR